MANYGALTAATLEGSHPGRVFVDRVEQPTAGLVCARAGIGYYFLAGQPSAAFVEELPGLFASDLIPAQKAALNNPEVILFYASPLWQAPLFTRLASCKPVAIAKKRFVLPDHALSALRGLQENLPNGFHIAPYSPGLFAAHPDLAEEAVLFYGSTGGFLDRSLGLCILEGETVASTCHAVFTGAGEAEISIHTNPDYRRRGLGFQAARAFLLNCLQRQLKPIWGCWPENAASVGLAARLGFIEDAVQPVCLWVDSPAWNP